MTLDRRITLYSPTVTTNNSGQVLRSFASAGTCYAMLVINEGAGTEAFVSDQMQSSAVVTWRVRYRTDVLGSWELDFNSQRYEVISALPEGRKRYTLIKCKLKDNG